MKAEHWIWPYIGELNETRGLPNVCDSLSSHNFTASKPMKQTIQKAYNISRDEGSKDTSIYLESLSGVYISSKEFLSLHPFHCYSCCLPCSEFLRTQKQINWMERDRHLLILLKCACWVTSYNWGPYHKLICPLTHLLDACSASIITTHCTKSFKQHREQ